MLGDLEIEQLGDAFAHHLAMRADARRLADQRQIEKNDASAGAGDEIGGVAQETVGRRAMSDVRIIVFVVATLIVFLASSAQAALVYIDRARLRHMLDEGTPRVGFSWYPMRPGKGIFHGTRINFNFAKGVKEPTIDDQFGSLYTFLQQNGGQSNRSHGHSPPRYFFLGRNAFPLSRAIP